MRPPQVQATEACNAALTLHPDDEVRLGGEVDRRVAAADPCCASLLQGVNKWAKKALEKFTNPFVDSLFESMLGPPQ